MSSPHASSAYRSIRFLAALGSASLAFAAEPPPTAASAAPPSPASPREETENPELARLYAEDQADRKPAPTQAIDWSVVGPRDAVRLARVKELYSAGELRAGADYYHAAMVLQHGAEPEDYLLAHELCVVALSKGYTRALWLAAATQDRFLRSIGRPQRFGTQYRSENGGATFLQETDERVSDHHRRAMKVPSLAEARARASRFDSGKSASLAPLPDAPALTQEIFTATDTADVALQKLRKLRPKSSDEAFPFIRGCRDLTLRYAAPGPRAEAFALAAAQWRLLTPQQIGQLAPWDVALGEVDPEFTPDQRAIVAIQRTYGLAAARAKLNPANYEAALLDETTKVALKHPEARVARERTVDAALSVAPELALPRLRELSPGDPTIAEGIRQLERIGKPCELELELLDGSRLNTRELRGKVVLIHFFSSRFPSALTAIPALQELVAQHGPDHLAVVGLTTDTDRDAARKIVAEHDITWPVHHDRTRHAGIVHQFRAQILPYFLLIDRAGNLRARGIQPSAPSTLQRVRDLLAEPAP